MPLAWCGVWKQSSEHHAQLTRIELIISFTRFMYRGSRVDNHDSPHSLGMSAGDRLEGTTEEIVMLNQSQERLYGKLFGCRQVRLC